MLKAGIPLFLASESPRRIAFLRELGLSFNRLSPPGGAEPDPEQGEVAARYAIRAARAKADAALCLAGPGSFALIAADTVVTLEGRIFGKPRDTEDALAMLRILAGRTHTVISGCAIYVRAKPGELVAAPDGSGLPPLFCSSQQYGAHTVFFAVESAVSMWDCPKALLEVYAQCGESLDKAGGYAVQGRGAFLIERIEGSWSNVVGLPLTELTRELYRLGVLVPNLVSAD